MVATPPPGAAAPKQALRIVSAMKRRGARGLDRVGLGWVGLEWAGKRWVGGEKRLVWSGVLGRGWVVRGWARMYEASLNESQPIFGAYRPREGDSGQF